MAKWSNEKMADLTRKLADTAIDYKQRCEELEAKLAQQGDLVQAAVAAALREAADAVEDYCSDAPDLAGHGHSRAIRDVITAIRKGKKHEPLAFPNHAAHRR